MTRRARTPEKAFMAQVCQLLTLTGWLWYHTHDSRRSKPGFPDIVAVRGERTVFIETKSDTGRLSPEQGQWVKALQEAGQEVYVWTPDCWEEAQVVLRR